MSNHTWSRNRKKKFKKVPGKGLSKKQKLQVSSMMQAPKELKFYDTAYDSTSVSITPVFYDLTGPAEGTGSDQRIGTEIELKSLQYRFSFVRGDDTNYLRYIIFQWYGDTAHDSPQWNQMFQYFTGILPGSLYDLQSPYQLGNGGTKLWRALVDEQFYLDSDNPIQMVKGFINKGFRKSIEYDEQTPPRGTGHVYMMLVSDSNVSAHPLVSGYTRARYYDS